MSMKNGKRSRRKTEDVESQDFKAPNVKKDSIKDDKKVVSLKEIDNEDLKGFDADLNGDSKKSKSRSNTPQGKKSASANSSINEEEPVKVIETVAIDEVIVENVVEAITIIAAESNGVVEEPAKVDTNGKDNDVENIEMEPLVLEEEVDPELQFDDNSDIDSRKDSPILTRCNTRRSQTRNIPTPKTPKSCLDQNGDEKELIEKPAQITPTPTSTPVPIDEIKIDDEKIDDEKIEFDSVDLNETRESFESTLSTRVNVGSDLTRDIDLTMPTDIDESSNDSSFLNAAKEQTVVETIRKMTSRRTIRPIDDYRKYLLRLNTEKNENSYEFKPRVSVERLSATSSTSSGLKRKSHIDTPDSSKRFKPEPTSNGFLSFISSPITKIKNRFSPNTEQVSASTPKLTGYKMHDILENADVSKINLDETTNPEKKWCLIM